MKLSVLQLSVAIVAASPFLQASKAGSSTAIDAAKVYERSEWWPPRVALAQPFTPPNAQRRLPAGREGVLIRVEPGDPPTVLIDFGRHGIASVPPEQTDLLARAAQIRSGEVEKRFPNWTMMLGRGFVDPSRGGSKVALRDLLTYKHFLILYLQDIEASAPLLKTFLNNHSDAIKATGTLPVIFPVRKSISMADYAEKLQAAGLDSVFMVPYLSDPYAASMRHSFDRPPFAVLTDVEGKTIHEPSAASQWSAILEELSHTLSRIAKQNGAGPSQ